MATVAILGTTDDPREARADDATCLSQDGWTQLPAPERINETGQRPVLENTGWNTAVAAAWQPERRLYAGGLRGLYASDNCGASWSRILPSSKVLGVLADHEGRVFAALYPPGTPEHRWMVVSDDAGATWRPITQERRSGRVDFMLWPPGGMAASPAGRVYIRSRSDNLYGGATGFGYTEDAGQTFVWTDSWGPDVFAADAANPTILYAYDSLRTSGPTPPYQLVKSVDSGGSFHRWSTIAEEPRAMAASVDGTRLWLATDEHLWQSRDRGASWNALGAMPARHATQIAPSPSNPDTLYVVAEDGHLWAYREPSVVPIQIPH